MYKVEVEINCQDEFCDKCEFIGYDGLAGIFGCDLFNCEIYRDKDKIIRCNKCLNSDKGK